MSARFDFVTLFPGMFAGPMTESIVGRARERGVLEVGFVNPRDFSRDKHRRVDDRPYGGGAGMVMMAEPLHAAIKSVKRPKSSVICLSAQGKRFDMKAAQRLAKAKHLIFVCGHYEGIDGRLAGLFDEEISIGDYVLTGGELPAMVVADSVARLVPGVLAKEESKTDESFVRGILDYPQYTRPRVWRGKKVPEVLLSGDHSRIADWRRRAATRLTRANRPDLLEVTTHPPQRKLSPPVGG